MGAKIKQCHFETLDLFDKITIQLLYYETSRPKNQPVQWHVGLVRWALVLVPVVDLKLSHISLVLI